MNIVSVRGKSFTNSFSRIIKTILEKGEISSPRQLSTIEVSPLIIQISNPHLRFISSKLINYPLTIIKQMQWLQGIYDIDALVRYDPGIRKLVDSQTGLYDGAYGPKIRPQLEFVYQLLCNDPDSRRAIISVFQITDQRQGRDIPTTLGMQFLIRNDELHMLTYMRSNDAWNGLPTDIHLFTFIQEVMAAWLNLKMGEYSHITGSGHIYRDAVPTVQNWLASKDNGGHQITPSPFSCSFGNTRKEVSRFLDWERSLALTKDLKEFFTDDPYIDWCAKKILQHYKSGE